MLYEPKSGDCLQQLKYDWRISVRGKRVKRMTLDAKSKLGTCDKKGLVELMNSLRILQMVTLNTCMVNQIASLREK